VKREDIGRVLKHFFVEMLLLKRGDILTKRRENFSTQGSILKTSLVGSQKQF